MAWDDTQTESDSITHTEWNNMVTVINANTSHSSNSNIHLTTTQLTDLTDGGTSSLHSHTTTTASGQNYAYDYVIYKDGSTYKAQDGSNGLVVSSNARFDVVANYCSEQLIDTGGDILIKAGNYTLSGGLWIYDNTTLTGVGMGTKIGFQESNFLYSSSEIIMSGSHTYVGNFQGSGSGRIRARYGRGKYPGTNHEWGYVTIENVYLSGMKMAEHTAHCHANILTDPAHSGTIHDVKILNCHVISSTVIGGFALLGQRNTADGVFGTKSMHTNRVWIDGCSARKVCIGPNRSTEYGIGFGVLEAGQVKDVWVTNCISEDTWESGFHFESATTNKQGYNITLMNCTAKHCGDRKRVQFSKGLVSNNVEFGNGFALHSGCSAINCKVYAPGLQGFSIYQGAKVINCYINGSGNVGSGCCHNGIKGILNGSNLPHYIEGNYIENIGREGIWVAENENNIIRNNHLRNISTSGGGFTGIRLGSNCDGTRVEGNQIYMNNTCGTNGAIDCQSRSIIKDNIIEKCPSSAIVLTSNDDDHIVMGNYIMSSAKYGIYASQSDKNQIINNKVLNCADNGIYIKGYYNVVANNIVRNCKNGIEDNARLSGFNQICNNMVSGNRTSAIRINRNDPSGTRIYGNVGYDENMRWSRLTNVPADYYRGDIFRASGGTNELTSIHMSVHDSNNDWVWVKLGESS